MSAMEKQSSGVLRHAALRSYEQYRKPAVRTIQRIQAMQARLLAMKNPALLGLRRMVAPLVRRTPLIGMMRDKIALGVQEVEVQSSYFR